MALYILTSIILLIPVFNGLIIIWGLAPDISKVKKIQDLWHGIGFVIRALLSVAIYLQFGIFYFWLSLILAWHIYDIIINKITGLVWYHTGENFFDRSPWCWYAKGLVLFTGLAFSNIPLSGIVGSILASYAILVLTGFVLFLFKKPALNVKLTKTAKKIFIILGILLILSLLFDGLLFKDMPRITNYFK